MAKPHKLSSRSDPPLSVCFYCRGGLSETHDLYDYCSTCSLEVHATCPWLESNDEIDITMLIEKENNKSDVSNDSRDDSNVSSDSGSSHSPELDDEDYDKCNCCQGRRTDLYYYCSTCNFSLNFACVKKLPPLTVTHLKSHDHSLTLFSRRLPSLCDACGFSLETVYDFVYTCLLCNYMIHRECIYLPRVIKITRHLHRLSFRSSCSSSGHLSCGVCRKPVDKNHGQYFCKKGCEYAVHSKCATRDDVWDGKDLEDIPEEDDEDKNAESFVRIDEETIQHFSHDQHYLRFHLKMNYRDDNKYCEACCVRSVLEISVKPLKNQ